MCLLAVTFLLLVVQTYSYGSASVQFLEYYEVIGCDDGSPSKCDIYFYKTTISDEQEELVYIKTTSSTSNTAKVNLQDVPELTGNYQFKLKTNTTVSLSLEVWDDDGASPSDKMRDIDNLVIPLNEIEATDVWSFKRFFLSDSDAYLQIKFKIETCYGNFGGLGCSFCIDNYYTILCNKHCQPVQGNYTCNSSGDKLCVEHKTGENCDMCQKEWRGEQCEECAENYFPEKVCNVKCTAVDGRYSCSDLGRKVCNENWKGAECDGCAEHRTGETCEECSKGWGGNKCQKCAQDYYPEGVCNVTCTEEKKNFTCTDDGRKACYENWRGEDCNNCSEEFFGEFCDVFCKETGNYNCSLTGEMVCLDQTTIVENNCKKISKLSIKYKIAIGAAIGISFLAVILIVGLILMQKNSNTSQASKLVGKTDTNHTKPEKTAGASKSGRSSTDLNTSSKEMTYATLNYNSSDRKSTENDKSFQNTVFKEADMTYATLNRELEHSFEDNNEQSNYTHLGVEKTRQTHTKKREENVNQGVPHTRDLKEKETYADKSVVVQKIGPNIESEKKVEQLAGHRLELSSEDDTYSHPTKFKSSIKDCCKEEQEEEETYADITILGPKEDEEPNEGAEDNEVECMYADVSFVGKRKEFGIQEDRINEKEGSAIYFTIRDTKGMNMPDKNL